VRGSPWVPRVLLGAAAIGLVAAVISIALGKGGPERIRIEGAGQVQELMGGIEEDGPYLGSPEAPVTVTVFNDLQAPSGASFESAVVDPLITDFVRAGDVRLELRHFSFTEAETNLAAYGAVAAGQQDYEWQYADLFFRNQRNAPHGRVTEEFMRDVANAVPNLDADSWAAALESGQVKAQVQADAQAALSLRLPAAPAVIVEGPGGTRKLVDGPSLDEVKAAIASVE